MAAATFPTYPGGPVYTTQPVYGLGPNVQYGTGETVVYDVETGEPVKVVPAEGYAAFADRAVRHGFLRKVFGTRLRGMRLNVCALYVCLCFRGGGVSGCPGWSRFPAAKGRPRASRSRFC